MMNMDRKILNPSEIVALLKGKKANHFYYIIHANSRSSKFFTPFTFKVVSYKDVQQAVTYMTISTNGVTQYTSNEIVFMPLSSWMKEYEVYLKLMKLKLFRLYRTWKAFYVWRKKIRTSKIREARRYLEETLFTCDHYLRHALMEIREMQWTFSGYTFFNTEGLNKMTIPQFAEMQFTRLEEIKEKLELLEESTVHSVLEACSKSLLEGGYTMNDSNIQIAQTTYGLLNRFAKKLKIPKGGPLEMSFIEQAGKRKKCDHLSRFIRLTDYMSIFLLRTLLENTYNDLLIVLTDHTELLPNFEQLTSLEDLVNHEDQKKASIQNAYFEVDIILSENGDVTVDPRTNVFSYVINKFQSIWERTLNKVFENYMADPHFQKFISPVINRKILKNRLPGDAGRIYNVMNQSISLQNYKKQLEELLSVNITGIKKYCALYEPIERFYKEEKACEAGIIENNEATDVFRDWCERYKTKEEEINEIIDSLHLGIFFLQMKRFKNEAVSIPIENQRRLGDVIPKIGREKVEAVLSELLEATNFLDSPPLTADDYVDYIKFLDGGVKKIDDMETQLDYIKEIYDIIEEYHIRVDPEDVANYLLISVALTSFKNTINRRCNEREGLISKFNEQINTDVRNLLDDASVINDLVSAPWLLDSSSNPHECLKTVKEFRERLKKCTDIVDKYHGHQKLFNLEVVRIEILDHVENEINLRILLWESITFWGANIKEWYESDFTTLDVEKITETTLQYLENIEKLEKTLGRRSIIQDLKENVDQIREKLPVMNSLRNKHLRRRHWLEIESLLNYKFKPDVKITLMLLETLGAFNYSVEVMEISERASSEANLEAMLSKVEEIWKQFEFSLVQHKGIGDTFVLVSLEDVYTALDESSTIIQTITASRYSGFIKLRLEEWRKKLDLFTATLEAWQSCQEQWIYLEAIFSAPDIQRQLPQEATMFVGVDKFWKDLMRRISKMPLAMVACTQSDLLRQLLLNNKYLDKIIKSLEGYLENKRIAFSRFFFLSDQELLEILAQMKNPLAIQRYLCKCFTGIDRLEFESAKPQGVIGNISSASAIEIVAIVSQEGERVEFGKGLKARGNVESWMHKVEESMISTLKRLMKQAVEDFAKRGRHETFLTSYPSQIILTVSQIFWARRIHVAFESKTVQKEMLLLKRTCTSELTELLQLIHSDLPVSIRNLITNLITIEVHGRDVISSLASSKITSASNFEWTRNLRYYWHQDTTTCSIKMSETENFYSYEYLGNQKRLVMTPLTERCYLSLLNAHQNHADGALTGLTATGKTETIRDLARAIAIHCIVFNCTKNLNFRIMGKILSGLATSGAWCCFDEFDRIDANVLSVIAQQLTLIRDAKCSKLREFWFEGRSIKLMSSCFIILTMKNFLNSSGKLPANLKSSLRVFSMITPDYEIIVEVKLFSEGFEFSKELSNKLMILCDLCENLMSRQKHYDFGMRKIIGALEIAGKLKKLEPGEREESIIIRAFKESTVPALLPDDTLIFFNIVSDLFPETHLHGETCRLSREDIILVMEEAQLQPEDEFIIKLQQIHEIMRMKHGVMIVGPTGSGKTTLLNCLNRVYTHLHETHAPQNYAKKVNTCILNPKTLTAPELYGVMDVTTNEWHPGLFSSLIRNACSIQNDDYHWIVFDGPVDDSWMENINTLLDDNKTLCLANSERIKLTQNIRIIFEAEELTNASPGVVTRCSIIYVNSMDFGWLAYVKTWLLKFKIKEDLQELKDIILNLFQQYLPSGLIFSNKNCDHAVSQVNISRVSTMCCILESILSDPDASDAISDKSRMKTFVIQSFVFSYLWAIGSSVIDSSREIIELFVNNQVKENVDARLPSSGDLWNFHMNIKNQKLDLWTKIIPPFIYNDEKFHDVLVPTIDTVRYEYIISKIINSNKSVLITGERGIGKSVIAKAITNNLRNSGEWICIHTNISLKTTSNEIQKLIESKLEKRKKGIIGAPGGRKTCIFVDDVNVTAPDNYNAKKPIELLRQVLDAHGFYDSKNFTWNFLEDVVLISTCLSKRSEENSMNKRFLRHNGIFFLSKLSEVTLNTIFRSVMRSFMVKAEFPQSLLDFGDRIINALVDVFNKLTSDLRPTPQKIHYSFDLRDLGRCVRGLIQADSSSLKNANQMMRLFYHECLRVFHDRLISAADRNYFYNLLSNSCFQSFGDKVIGSNGENGEESPQLIFGDFMGTEETGKLRIYEEITDLERLERVLQKYTNDYCITSKKALKMTFFPEAIQHLCTIARILRMERGNGLLIGAGGVGKRILTKLASHLNGFLCFEIEMGQGYDITTWQADLRRIFIKSGASGEDVTFLLTETQIEREEFLEDVNTILTSGEVPHLFEGDELEKVFMGTQEAAKQAGVSEENRDDIYRFFIEQVKNHLHLILCMSPLALNFRQRFRNYSSLIYSCTINWFFPWSKDALFSVAEAFLIPPISEDSNSLSSLASTCVLIHESIERTTKEFYSATNRYCYISPSNYLELLNLYSKIYKEKTEDLTLVQDRMSNALKKLEETNEMVKTMNKDLIVLTPQFKESSEEVARLLKNLEVQKSGCEKLVATIAKETTIAEEKAEEVSIYEAQLNKEFDSIMVRLGEAEKALMSLSQKDVNDIRVFTKPPPLVLLVMEAICLLLGERNDWNAIKVMLSDANFLDRLMSYKRDEMPDNILHKLQEFTENNDFTPEPVSKQSKGCKTLCVWIRTINDYAKKYKSVEPRRAKFKNASKELEDLQKLLELKNQQLSEVEMTIAALDEEYQKAFHHLNKLETEINLSEMRVNRSGRLKAAVSEEIICWQESMNDFTMKIKNFVGDSLLAAGTIAYLGVFDQCYRLKLFNSWIDAFEVRGIYFTSGSTFIEILGDSQEMHLWNGFGLGRDRFSVENALIISHSRKWPLIIDPQDQAHTWIKNKEIKNKIKICRMTNPDLLGIIENCVKFGTPIIICNVGEILNASLDGILSQDTFIEDEKVLIWLNNNLIELSEGFKLYITTQEPNPRFSSEVFKKVTIINFTSTSENLEDKLLTNLLKIEKPELEKSHDDVISKIHTDELRLKIIKTSTLSSLLNNDDNILDNEELIECLNDSKEDCEAISMGLTDLHRIEGKILVDRDVYRSAAIRGSILYFVVVSLMEIDSIYRFSLGYFIQLFNNVILEVNSMKELNFEERLKIICHKLTFSIYSNVSRSLFEMDKLVLSFMLNMAIHLNDQTITPEYMNFLLHGYDETQVEEKPDYSMLSESMWKSVNYLNVNFMNFNGIVRDVLRRIKLKIGFMEEEINLNPENKELSQKNWDLLLNDVEKLILLKCLKEEKLLLGMRAYLAKDFGEEYVVSPDNPLLQTLQNSTSKTPLLLILSANVDPVSSFINLARQMGFSERSVSISCGQEQEQIAEDAIKEACINGQWLLLQHCNLASSWLSTLDRIIDQIIGESKDEEVNVINFDGQIIHKDFRFFLSTTPFPNFPSSISKNSLKIAIEPPKTLKNHLKHQLSSLNKESFENNDLGSNWKSIVLSLCFFHSIIQERRKFSSLGWNSPYEFNDSDRESCLINLQRISEYKRIPWNMITYITEITYGKMDNNWDMRCLRTILQKFLSPAILEQDFRIFPSKKGFSGLETLEEYISFVNEEFSVEKDEFMEISIIEVHKNAEINLQLNESRKIIDTLSKLQENRQEFVDDDFAEEIVYKLAKTITEKIKHRIRKDTEINEIIKDKKLFSPLTIVLHHEIERYNSLLSKIHSSLDNLQLSIKGIISMSFRQEYIFNDLMNNKVPVSWCNIYQSNKNLASWIKDLQLRIEFINDWLINGEPLSFWLSGFSFPREFIVGIIQLYARKNAVTIDLLDVDWRIQSTFFNLEKLNSSDFYDELKRPDAGVLIHGLYFDTGRWDLEKMILVDPIVGENHAPLPVIHVVPVQNGPDDSKSGYECPIYDTSLRRNYLATIPLKSSIPSEHWILRGTALLLQLD